MINNSQAEKMTIVPSPVIIFTQSDAIRAARKAPIVERPTYDNLVIVAAMVTAEGIVARTATLLVTHHVQSHRTKKTQVAGSWRVDNIPVTPTEEKHVFNLAWPSDS